MQVGDDKFAVEAGDTFAVPFRAFMQHPIPILALSSTSGSGSKVEEKNR